MVYSDFCDAFRPQDPYYANLLANRSANYLLRGGSKLCYFQRPTRDAFFKCLRVHFEAEESIELLKKRLSRRPKFNVRDTFKYLDCLNQGHLSRDSLLAVLEDNLYYPTEMELNFITDRFDRNRNGKITYNDFMDELMPKNSINA